MQAAVRALDTIADFAVNKQPGVSKIDKFVVAGASKVSPLSGLLPCSPQCSTVDTALLAPLVYSPLTPLTCAAGLDHMDRGGSGQTSGGNCAHCHGPIEHVTSRRGSGRGSGRGSPQGQS